MHNTYGDVHEAVTVAQLIEKLRQLPPDSRVFVEGCDCNGPCTGAEETRDLVAGNGHERRLVLLRRAPI